MRMPRFIALFASVVLLAVAPAAGASILESGRFTLRIGSLPRLALQAGGNSSAFVGSPAGTFIEPSGVFTASFVDYPDVLFTGMPLVADLRLSGLSVPVQGATGRFATGGLATTFNPVGADFANRYGGGAPLDGEMQICLLGCAAIQVAIPLDVVGVGGTFHSTGLLEPLTLQAGPGWTTAPAQVTGIHTEIVSWAGNTCAAITCPTTTLALGTGIGVYTTRVTLTGGRTLTTGGGGSVLLVTPARLRVAGLSLPIFATQRLTVSHLPEPGALALLGAGVLALTGRGLRLRRVRRRP